MTKLGKHMWNLITSILVASLLIIALHIYEQNQPKFTLTKSEWVCHAAHVEETTDLIPNGNGGYISVINAETVCDNYKRRN